MPSTASKRFRSATAVVQGRGVASNKGKTGPSITSLVPDVLQHAGPRMTVAAKRNIFMHARAYLHGQCRSNLVDERKMLVQSVIAGTRLHQKQESSVTTMKEHVVEQQEERKRSKEKEEELAALEISQEPLVEVEEEYHAANSTLTSVGILHEQVPIPRGHLWQRFGIQCQPPKSTEYIQEAQKTGVLASSFLQDLQGELARMREVLQSAKEQEAASSTEQHDVLQMVGAIYEDIAKLQLTETESAPPEGVLESELREAMGEEVNEDEVGPEEDTALLDQVPSTEGVTSSSVAEDPALIPDDGVEEEAQTTEVTSDVASDVLEVPVSPAASLTLPSLAEAEPPEPLEAGPDTAGVTVALRSARLPALVATEEEAEETEEAMEAVTTLLGPVEDEAACDMESASPPTLPRLAPEALDVPEVEAAEPLAPAVATAVTAPAKSGIPEEGAAAQVRKVRRRQLIMAPDIRLPALSARNRKNTADLDWNMEHLNQEELKLLNSVIAEDGVEASKSVVHDPKKERLWKQIWGLAESPRKLAAAKPKLKPLKPVADVDEDSFLVPRKAHTLPDLSEKPNMFARGVRHRRVS